MSTNASPVCLRSATSADQRFVDELTRRVMWNYVTATWSEASDIAAYFAKNKFDLGTTRIIQWEGQDVGRISIIRSAEDILLDNIHLDPRFQSKGIGCQVLEEVLREARANRLPVRLQVLRSNPAKKLYEKLGFTVIREDKTHYFMRWME